MILFGILSLGIAVVFAFFMHSISLKIDHDIIIKKESIHLLCAIISFVLSLNFLLYIGDTFILSHNIGSFFESRSYSDSYIATFSYNDEAFPAVVEVNVKKEDGRTSRTITDITFPYNKKGHVDDGMNVEIEDDNITFNYDWNFSVYLSPEPATPEDINYVITEYRFSNPKYFASINSDIYHVANCPHCKQIENDGLMKLNVAAVRLYDLSPCDYCINDDDRV